jgi:hypothetical protein
MADADYSWVANLSPYAVTVISTAAVILGLSWLRNKRKDSELAATAQTAAQVQLDAIERHAVGTSTHVAELATKVETTQTALERKIDAVETRVNDVKADLARHVQTEDATRDAQTEVLREIHKQLVSLNAGLTGSVVNQENAKLIIGYQWNWCRDETIRVVLRSIKDNHFRGNESVVARHVYRGWNKAASDALASLERIDGLKYPFSPLFLRHVDYIWTVAWLWGVPLYYETRNHTFDNKLADLGNRISDLFDLVYATHIDVVEDVAYGAVYRDDHPARSSVVYDETAALRMGDQLRKYSGVESNGQLAAQPTPESVRSIVRGNIDDMYGKRSSASGELTPVPRA